MWGDEPERPGERMANFWHGDFPWRHDDGYGSTAPVGSYPANGYGLYDMAGNVWEWTSDWWYRAIPRRGDESCCVPSTRRGDDRAAATTPHSRSSASPAR